MRNAILATLSFITAVATAHSTSNSSGSAKEAAVYATYTAKPDYPYMARVHHMEGSGVFLGHIRADGSVRLVETVQTTGHVELDNSTIAAFQKWRFRVNRPTQVKIPITFLMGSVRTGNPIPAISR
jgi:TonB family protein